MESLLSQKAQHKVNELRPHDSDTLEMKADADGKIKDYFDTCPDDLLFDDTIKGPCMVHPGMSCPKFDLYDNNNDSRNRSSSSAHCDVSESAVTIEDSPTEPADAFGDIDSDGDIIENTLGGKTLSNMTRRLTGFEFGSTCVDFSRRGRQQGLFGSSVVAFMIMIRLIVTLLPSCFWHEITDQSTEDIIKSCKDLIEAGYRVFSIVMDPIMWGKPVKRPRRYSFGWLTKLWTFHGSEDNMKSLLRRSCDCTAEVFFCQDSDRAQENFDRACHHRNHFPSAQACVDMPLEMMYLPKTVSKINDHLSLKEQFQGSRGELCCDAEQGPSFSTPGSRSNSFC